MTGAHILSVSPARPLSTDESTDIFLDFSSANPLTVSKLKCSMRRHVDKCTTMFYTENKRLIHCPGQRPNRYVSIEEHGIALDNSICKTEIE